jgi:hypothetical protein
MPCNDYRSTEAQKLADPYLVEENAMLTAMLCEVGKAILNRKHVPPRVINWWKEHSHLDAIRGEPWNKESST